MRRAWEQLAVVHDLVAQSEILSIVSRLGPRKLQRDHFRRPKRDHEFQGAGEFDECTADVL